MIPPLRCESRDAKRPNRKTRPKLDRAERDYQRALSAVSAQVGKIINGFLPGDLESLPQITKSLADYADLLVPWAKRTASRMLTEVNARDLDAWRALSQAIGRQLRYDIRHTQVGDLLRARLADQVTLIKSLPLEAGQRVHELTLKGLENSERALSYVDEIMQSGNVCESRARLIARTETSRTATALTHARAQSAGSVGYFWTSSHDATVRESHQAMDGQFVRWNEPPSLDGMTGHAGEYPNCRCWCRTALPDDSY